MSASKNKKMRMEAKNAPDAAANAPLTGQQKEKRKYRITVAVISIVLVIFILAVILLSSSVAYNRFNSVKIGNEKFTTCEYSFYYGAVYQQYYSMLANYYGSSMDASMMPGSDVLQPEALSLMQRTVAVHHAAEEAGYEMDEDAQKQIETYMSSAQSAAAQYTNGDIDEFLVKNYCRGMSEKIYRECVEYYVYATSYGMSVYNGYSYTADELSAYYADNADEFDIFSYDWFLFKNEDYDDKAVEEANAFLEQLKAGEDFKKVAYEFATDEKKESYDSGSSTTTTLSGSSLSDTLKGWLTDASRDTGDCDVIETDNGAYVVQFLSRDNNDYHLVNFRHILISPETINESDYETDEVYQQAKEEADATAKEEADMYYMLWKENPTEENFGEMATQYSDDSPEGGLYENVYKGQMVAEVNDWIFDASRKDGDTAIVKTEYGYHIMYFAGKSDTRYCDTMAESEKREEDYSNWQAECIGDSFETSTNSIFKLTAQ